MVAKVKLLYFGVLALVAIAFIFHVVAMGHHRWKIASSKQNNTKTTIGLFTRCFLNSDIKSETCVPNSFPDSSSLQTAGCDVAQICSFRTQDCGCDYAPSTKGIAACAIIAAIFLGLSLLIIFVHSINTSSTRVLDLLLGLLPFVLLVLSFIFILITLILVGSYLSRDMMLVEGLFKNPSDLSGHRNRVNDYWSVRIDWSTILEIIALVLTFISVILYGLFVFTSRSR